MSYSVNKKKLCDNAENNTAAVASACSNKDFRVMSPPYSTLVRLINLNCQTAEFLFLF